MQGDHAVARELLLEGFGFRAGLAGGGELVALVEQVVHHHVADVEHRVGGLALAQQVVHARRLGAEEPVGDAVGDEAVDLLGHPHVAAAQAGLHVGHRDAELLGVDGAGQGGVHVAHHQHAVGPRLQADLLEGHHDLGGLGGVAAAAGVEVVVGLGDAQLVEEDVAHLPVVVLAGVDDLELEAVGTGLQRAHDGRDLHEVGARTGDEVDQRTGHTGLHGQNDRRALSRARPGNREEIIVRNARSAGIPGGFRRRSRTPPAACRPHPWPTAAARHRAGAAATRRPPWGRSTAGCAHAAARSSRWSCRGSRPNRW